MRANLKREQQCLGARHGEGRLIAGEQLTFKDTSFVRADRLAERIGYRGLGGHNPPLE